MPARVLVFCTHPVPRTTVAELEAALRDADRLTLAECHELPEGEDAAVDASPALLRVRDHVARTVAIVSFEMGIPGSNHLAATITEVLAVHFAERADGLVWFYYRDFVSPDDRGATLLTMGR